MSDDTVTEDVAADEAPASGVESMSWQKLVETALGLESRPQAVGLLHMVLLTKGKAGATVPQDRLCEALDVESVSTLLAKLEGLGWCRRVPVLVDGKARISYVTTTAVVR